MHHVIASSGVWKAHLNESPSVATCVSRRDFQILGADEPGFIEHAYFSWFRSPTIGRTSLLGFLPTS